MNRTMLRRSLLALAWTAWACTQLSSTARAEAIGGDATATDRDATCEWTSTIDPNPALRMENCPWITNGLTAQGYTEANGWTITMGTALTGTISIEKYYAWVTTSPTLNNVGGIEGNNYPGSTDDRRGGAVLELKYEPGEGDPSGVDVHWIQAVRTNDPSQHGIDRGHNEGGGYYQYIDNGLNFNAPAIDPPNPLYDTRGAAGSTWFLDRPLRYCEEGEPCDTSIDWEAQVFLTTFNHATKTITMYDQGVWWGYNFTCVAVPEPSSFALAGIGLVICICVRRRQRR